MTAFTEDYLTEIQLRLERDLGVEELPDLLDEPYSEKLIQVIADMQMEAYVKGRTDALGLEIEEI